MATAFACGSALAADKVTIQLKWLPQAQFAGYYVAAAKGFYKEANLDVTIKPTTRRVPAGTLVVKTAQPLGPLAAYLLLHDVQRALWLSVIVTLTALAAFGGIKARFTGVP